MRKILLSLFLLTLISSYGAVALKTSKEIGVYYDTSNSVPEEYMILPPHPENIPKYSYYPQPLIPFDKTYDTTGAKNTFDLSGLNKTEPIYIKPTNLNKVESLSNRTGLRFYTKDQYLDVWCDGKKYAYGADCVTEKYALFATYANDWVKTAKLLQTKEKQIKEIGKEPAMLILVEEIANDIVDMYSAKQYYYMYNVPVFFVTIDSYIPRSYILD